MSPAETGGGGRGDRTAAELGDCARLVQRYDPDRFLTAVTAPPARRPDLFALYAFNAEVAKTRDAVSEPMLGEIRLQWWRETIAGCFAGEPRRHEVAEPLTAAISETGPDRALFDTLIDARAGDLDDTPPADLAAFESYADATSGGLIRLAAQMLGVTETPQIAAAANDVGRAYALVGSIRALPFQVQQKRYTLPQAVLGEHGADEADILRARSTPELHRAVRALLETAEARLASARARRRDIPAAATPAFLAARVAASHVRLLRRVGGDPYAKRLAAPPALHAAAVAWGARTGRW